MAISLVGKIVITLLTLGVVGGMTAVIYLVVTDESVPVVTPDGPDLTPDGPGAPDRPDGPDGPGLESTTEEGTSAPYRVGAGIADMTGPCVEITFMGYAEVGQSGRGLHLRQFSRAFIFQKEDTRVVLVVADVQAVGIAVRREVVRNLQELYGNTYTLRNVIISGTHTHAAPGGHLVDFLLDVSILGFSQETFDAYVAGITRSIVRAHENIVPARLYYGQTTIKNAHMNRSPYSYENNPDEEKDRYTSDTDDMLTQVRIVREDGNLHGVLNWYAVHATSLNMSNQLVSSDNFGYAAITLEKTLNPGAPTGKGNVVAGFFPSNIGDVSPNIRGARCEFSGDQCDNQFYVCAHQERCFSLGPGDDMYESTRIIGTALYEGALEVLGSPGEELLGEVSVVHQFVNMPNETVPRYDTLNNTFILDELVSGCVPAMGYSFASGTIDGANTLNITQGTIQGNPLLDTISGIVAEPTEEDVACHMPKPILLATGRANFPLPWHPRIVSVTLIWLGDLVILGIPGEPTTMSGRRMRAAVGQVMESHGFEPRVQIMGITNEYIHYVATYEEYQIQRYEAASTIYGPYTLDIFIHKFTQFATAVIEGSDVDPGVEPADYRNQTLSLILPVVLDTAPFGSSFGDVLEQPPPTVRRGETVSATFVAANPRNDLKQESSHAVVERFELGGWNAIATDADWETRFTWERVSTLLGTSQVTFEWTVPQDAILAQYRIVYNGVARRILSGSTEFTGTSNTFTIDATRN